MFVSIITPAYNSGSTIVACIESLRAQSYEGQYEIILVDNGSTDNTVELAEMAGVDKIIRAPCATVYGARNEAIACSKGDVLAFIDSDCIADQDWLLRGVEVLDNCDVVSGHILPQESEKQLLYYYDKYVARAHSDRNGTPVNIAAGNAMMKRSVFESVGGFDATLQTAGDSIFSMQARKNGFEIQHSAESIVYHPVDDLKRRLRGLFREGDGAFLKSPFKYVDQRVAQKVWIRMVNFFQYLSFDLHAIEQARKQKSIGRIMAIRLSFFSIFMKMLSYLAVFSARYCEPVSRRLARR